MHLQITNKTTLALDAFGFSFESAGALELLNEYSGLANRDDGRSRPGNRVRIYTYNTRDSCLEAPMPRLCGRPRGGSGAFPTFYRLQGI